SVNWRSWSVSDAGSTAASPIPNRPATQPPPTTRISTRIAATRPIARRTNAMNAPLKAPYLSDYACIRVRESQPMVSSLSSVVAIALPRLSAISEQKAAQKPAPGKWSKKEILGHLIDSAANNHQRLVRLQLEREISLPGYEQDGWVRVTRYQDLRWPDLISLWAAYNRHLATIIESIDP